MIFDALLRFLVRSLLALRYRIRVTGLDEIARRGRGGILFLPNHPGLIDPPIVYTLLHRLFRPRVLVDRDQVGGIVGFLVRRLRGIIIPSSAVYGAAAKGEIETALQECARALQAGDNLLLYPAGRIYRSRLEDLRGNTGVERILELLPDVRIVLVRTRGLWGSSFGWASGRAPEYRANFRLALRFVLANGILFGPRREVSVEFVESADLPRKAGRNAMNQYLEGFYNADAPGNSYVPYFRWEKGGVRAAPEPPASSLAGDVSAVPAATRQIVTDYLKTLTGRKEFRDEDRLAQDLNLDSLARTDLLVWVQKEFGFAGGDAEALQTFGDVLLAACGEALATAHAPLKPIPAKWFRSHGTAPLWMPPGERITDAFLKQAARHPGWVVAADQTRGACTYRDVITSVLVLQPLIAALPGARVGIMLPAAVGADIVYLATLFAGKTPVMINWTVGPRSLRHCLDLAEVKAVLSADAFLAKLGQQGLDLSALDGRLVSLEKLTRGVTPLTKLRAFLGSYLNWGPLRRAKVGDTAVVLFTSGSEALPKAVPLSHANLLANLRDVLHVIPVTNADSMLGMLPPFHSFGLTITMLAPLCAGIRVVHHPNPTDAQMLARVVAAYKVTMLLGTPTFLGGIVRASKPGQLDTLRLAVTGAEKCSERVYAALTERCPKAVVMEGYGITECSPVVSINNWQAPKPFTIGTVLPGIEYLIMDEQSGQPAAVGQPGMLLVRGPSVFGGYLHYDGASPFVELAGKSWYRTGDLVTADADSVLTFRGRKKRFVKIGGEMISLPAIEEALEKHYPPDEKKGPVIAVEATPAEERPELVLFTTIELDRQAVNEQLQKAGLSALHNIRQIVRLDAIPLLGTGKTDYQALKERLKA